MDGLAARSARFEGETSSSRFEELCKERERRRRLYESSPHPLPLVGMCQEMCPEYERYEREVHLDLSQYEMLAGTEKPQRPGDHPKIDHGRAVKKYHRPAAGNEAPLPEDVRPAPVLRRTMDYLVGLVEAEWSRGGLETFAQVQKFVRDRTRSIRQDATLQNLRTDRDSIAVHQEIARFHILCGHRLCELAKTDFDAFQNTEQLRKVLQSLSEFYVDRQQGAGSCGCEEEGEFRAYYLLTHLEDPDVFRRCFRWPASVLSSAPVQLALTAGAAFHQSDYITFFRLPTHPHHASMDPRVLYLCCCLLHTHFPAMRLRAATIIAKAYAPGSELPATTMFAWLGFQDECELVDWGEAAGFQCTRVDGCLVSMRKPPSVESFTVRARRNDRLIESLVHGVPITDIVQIKAYSANRLVPQHVRPHVAPVAPKPVQITQKIPMPVQKPAFVPPTPTPLAVSQTPVVPQAPVVPLTLQVPKKMDSGPLARIVLDNLLYWVCGEQVLQHATSVCDRHNRISGQIKTMSAGLLSALIGEEIEDISKRRMEFLLDERKKQVDCLADQILTALLWTVTDSLLIDVAEEVTKEHLLHQFRSQTDLRIEPDPLAQAYETAIHTRRIELVLSERKPKRVRVLTGTESVGSRQGVAELQAALDTERDAAARFEAYLRTLL